MKSFNDGPAHGAGHSGCRAGCLAGLFICFTRDTDSQTQRVKLRAGYRDLSAEQELY